MIFDHIANGIQRHAKAIIVIWVLILCMSGFLALNANDVMSYDMNEMAPEDSESMEGLKILSDYFPTSEADENSMPILVLYFENATGLAKAQTFVEDLDSYASDYEHITGAIAMDPMTDSSGKGIVMAFITLEGLTLTEVAAFTPDVRDFIADVMEATGFNGAEYLTGSSAMTYDMEHNALEDISKIDPFTVLMILILVGLFFRSFVSSGIPPMTIGVAFVVAMALIFILGQYMNIFYITNMMILVSMMGAGCDYCIFIIARYREELRAGLSHDDALHQAIVWAGESITISGASVIIGFGAMSVCNYSLISTMGICLALGVLIALLAALTLIPSILHFVGDKVFWPSTMKTFKEGGKSTKGWYAWCAKIGERYFDRSAKFSLKHAKAIVLAALVATAPAAYLVMETENSYDMITSMLSGESGDGMGYIADYADQGMVMPNYSIIEYKSPIATITKTEGQQIGTLYWTDYWNDRVSSSLTSLYAEMVKDDNVAYASGSFVWEDMLEAIEAAGITETDEKVAYIKEHTSAKTGMIFNQMVETMSGMGMDTEYIFEGPGALIDSILASYTIDFNWDEEVAISKESGLTDPAAIIADVDSRFEADYPAMGQMLTSIIMQIKQSGVTDDMLVNGAGSTVNAAFASAGMTIDWDDMVATAIESGLTDPDEIVASIIDSMPESARTGATQIIAGLNGNGLSNAILVYGFGPVIDSVFDSMRIEFDWDAAVAAAIAVGITDPDEIVAAIEGAIVAENPTIGQMLTAIVISLNESGISNEILVSGSFGPIVDYIMNVSAAILGGPYAETGSGDATYISIITATDAPGMSTRSMESISVIAAAVSDYATKNSAIVKAQWNTGSAVVMYDVSEEVKKEFAYIELLVIVLILILLFVVMRSYLIPFRSVLTILMSIVWTLAVTRLVFVDLLGGDMLWMIPIILLVICLGLGMDYDILLTTRIKENVMALGMSNDDAIYHAVTHTGSVITICGLIMGGAFGTLMISGMNMMQEFGFALCFAILVDALIVRTYIVPAVMHLLGDWNWKGPGVKYKSKSDKDAPSQEDLDEYF